MVKKRKPYIDTEKRRLNILKILANYKKNTSESFKARFLIRKHDEKEGWVHNTLLSSALKRKGHHKIYTIKDKINKNLIISINSFYQSSNKNKNESSPLLYKLKEDKRTFLKLYILFYEANEINFFINSDYSIDNKNIVEKLLFDLEFTFDDIIRKETDLPKKERIILKKERMEDYKSIYKIYPYNKSIELFYYYAKNKVKFKQSVNQFVDEFEKKGVEPKHFEELLDFSLKLLRKFDESLNNKISDKDISQLYKVYEDLGSKRIVGDITRKLNWINPMAKFLLNNIHDVVGFLYLHEKEFDKFRKDPNHLKKRTEILNKRKHPFECNLKNWKEVHKNKQK